MIVTSHEIDAAYDTTVEDMIAMLNREYGVVVAVTNESSGGGCGWPLIKLIGEREDVLRCFRIQWDGGDDREFHEAFVQSMVP